MLAGRVNAPVRGPLPSRSGMLAIVTLIGALAGRHPAAAFVPFPSRVAPQAPVRLGRVGSIQERPARLLPAALAPRGARSLRPICTAVATATDSQASHSVSSTAIIGGGPSGLATAIMLAQKGWTDVHVYDRLPAPPSPDDDAVWGDTARFYLIGLGGRGQKALKELGVWDEVDRFCTTVVGRMDWAPGSGPDEGVERIFTDRPYLTKVIARDRLVGVLHRVVTERYAEHVRIHHGVACTDVEWLQNEEVEMTVQPTRAADSEVATGTASKLRASLVIGADGAARTVADCLEAAEKAERGLLARLPTSSRLRVTRYTDDNQRVYKTIPIKLPKGWRGDLNYSARTKDGRINIDALPASKKNEYCAVLLLKADDEMAKANTDAAQLRHLLDNSLPMFSPLIDEPTLANVASKDVSLLPFFRYVGPKLHRGRSTLLLGDAVHTVKPYFGLGANSALEDVVKLSASLDKHAALGVACVHGEGVSKAIADFSTERAAESKALVKMSREFDRPGLLGLLSFVLPLILDGIFNKIAPKVFGPNTIAMLQNDKLSFQQVRFIKRRDRMLQLAVIGSALAAAFHATTLVLRLAPASSIIAVFGSALAWLAVSKLNLSFFLRKNTSPADVLAKTKQPLSSSNAKS